MSNLENAINGTIPIITKGVILIGITLCLLSVTIALCRFIKQKQSLKEIGVYLIHTSGIGILVSISGILINFIANFDIEFSTYKYSIPLGYVITLVVFLLLTNIINTEK